MKRPPKVALGGTVTLIVLSLFLLPIIPIKVGDTATCDTLLGCIVPTFSASASPTYAYLGMGAVYVHNPLAAAYCFVVGNPRNICGFPVERTNQETTGV